MDPAAALLDPVGWSEFVGRYLDRDHLVLAPDPAGRRRALYDLDAFDRLLSRPAISAQNLFAIDARRKIGPADYSHADGSADVLRMIDLFDQGATIVFREADRHDPELWRLTRAIERALCAPAFANVYYAPAAGQSFPVHYDAIDVFALQLAGTKRWTLWPRIDPLPLAHEHCYGEGGHDTAGTDPMAAVTLDPGSLIYVPRGMPHLVTAGDDPSLHISISVTPFTYDELLRQHAELNRAAPGRHRDRLAVDDLAIAPADPPPLPDRAQLAALRRSALMARVPVAIDRPLRARDLSRGLTASSRLVADCPGPWFIEPCADHIRIIANGRAIGFLPGAAAAIAHAMAGAAFAAGDLPGLADDPARIDLAATLLANGLVRPA